MTATPSHRAESSRESDLEARVSELERSLELARLHGTVALAAHEARTDEELLSMVLEELCRRTGWPAGHAFLRGCEGKFHPMDSWYLDRPDDFARLREVTRTINFGPGEGTIGKVAASGRPVWISDVGSESDFIRGERAPGEVKAVVAVPVTLGDEAIGVLEFLADRVREKEQDLLDVLVDVGTRVAVGLERIRTIRALRISEETFSGIVSISAEAMISIDEDQRIVLFNEGAEDIFGYESDEVLGRHLDVLIPARFRDVHRSHVRIFGTSGEKSRRMGERRDVFGVRKSGEEFPAQASISRLNVEGEVLYSVVLRDVTEQQVYEESLRRHSADLERSNRELEQFAFVASHDLQEPLRKIQAFGDRLMSHHCDDLDERGRDYLGRMHRASERMSTLVQDLLAFSRVTTRGRPFERVDLERVVREAVSDLDQRIRDSDGRVEVGELPTMQADPSQMRQLFQNLIGNALKYHREGVPPRVEIRSRIVDDSGKELADADLDGAGSHDGSDSVRPRGCEIQVRDNGIGFEDVYAERIFEIFNRLHGRSEYDGTGIGLAICRKIVERHDGTLTARATPGEGATFTIDLPFLPPSPAEEHS